MQTEVLKIEGMTCGGCTSNVTNALNALPGIGHVTVSLSSGDATVEFDERLVSPDRLRAAVEGAGYGVGAAGAAHDPSKGGCCG